MNKFLLVTHSSLAEGFYKSTDFLSGQVKNMTFINAYVDDSDWTQKAEEWIKSQKQDTNIIVLTDLFGGSVNQKMTLLMNQYHFTLITGINLPLVLSLALESNELSNDRIKKLVSEAQQSLEIVEEPKIEEDTNEDEFLD